MDGERSKRGKYWLEASTWQKEKTQKRWFLFVPVCSKFTHKKRFHKVYYYYLPVTELS